MVKLKEIVIENDIFDTIDTILNIIKIGIITIMINTKTPINTNISIKSIIDIENLQNHQENTVVKIK